MPQLQLHRQGSESGVCGSPPCALRDGILGLPGGPVVKNLSAKAVDTGLTPGLGRVHLAWGN